MRPAEVQKRLEAAGFKFDLEPQPGPIVQPSFDKSTLKVAGVRLPLQDPTRSISDEQIEVLLDIPPVESLELPHCGLTD